MGPVGESEFFVFVLQKQFLLYTFTEWRTCSHWVSEQKNVLFLPLAPALSYFLALTIHPKVCRGRSPNNTEFQGRARTGLKETGLAWMQVVISF
jgi:hypothetical protein